MTVASGQPTRAVDAACPRRTSSSLERVGPAVRFRELSLPPEEPPPIIEAGEGSRCHLVEVATGRLDAAPAGRIYLEEVITLLHEGDDPRSERPEDLLSLRR